MYCGCGCSYGYFTVYGSDKNLTTGSAVGMTTVDILAKLIVIYSLTKSAGTGGDGIFMPTWRCCVVHD